jgi:hypothetical protein
LSRSHRRAFFGEKASFVETAPPILSDIEAARSFIRELDRASDLMEAGCSAAVLVLLVLDAHLERVGKDNHAQALLETAQWLHARLAQLVEVWKTVEE